MFLCFKESVFEGANFGVLMFFKLISCY
jgi:hypothetical protein